MSTINPSSFHKKLVFQGLPAEITHLTAVDAKVEKVFKVTVSDAGKVEILASPNSSKRKSVIYKFWNKETAETYFGKTDGAAGKRWYAHSSSVNAHSSSVNAQKRKQTKFHKAIKTNPLDFRFGIVEIDSKILKNPKNLSLIEKKLISTEKKEKRLNSNLGGGGGTSASCAVTDPNLGSPKKFTTPERYYPLQSKENSLRFDLTPTNSKAKGVIYSIRQKSTDKRYIGMTGTELRERLWKHCSKAKTTENPEDSIHTAINNNPSDFEAGVLAKNIPSKELPKLEAEYIKTKKSFTAGFNKNRGGGGSSVSKN